MRVYDQSWSVLKVIRAFFPLQLVIYHIKHNIFGLLFWVFLFMIVKGGFGRSFGLQLLFLSPEYLGQVSAWSFFLVGFALGGFLMGFNTYSYIKLGPYFPFLTTISKPFFKFCINNALIPVTFGIYYFVLIYNFQRSEEFASLGSVLLYLFALCLGVTSFIVLSFFYFFPLIRKQDVPGESGKTTSKPISSFMFRREKWYDSFVRNKDRTYIYFGKWMRLMPSRSSRHFNKKLVEQVYAKNKISASIFEILTIVVFFVLGLFSSYEVFEIPAATSIVLLLTILLMLFSALHSWLGSWLYPVFIVLILFMDRLSIKTEMFNYTNYAYGLNYTIEARSKYTIDRMQQISNNDKLNIESYNNFIQILNNWKERTGEMKPKLILLNTSGGGSRSALWTFVVLQQVDKEMNGNLSEHIELITGASGGIVGAAYFRELLLRHKKGEIKNLYSVDYIDNISKDMLNKLSFMATTNDMFIRYQKCEYNGFEYTKDRGYAFEEQLHENTGHVLEHSLKYYENYEKSAMIPTMVFTPTIINDGRRIFISSQSMNFLTENHGGPSKMTRSNENIEFHSLLDRQNTGDVRFSTVLRASATFPFVMPMVTLPTKPKIQLMDAGIRDNYGGKTMMEFLHVMKNWIKDNTSGVIILQIRDTKKVLDDENYSDVSFLDKITLPFGNMYKNFPRVQDFDQEELMKIGVQSLDFPVDLISFNLRQSSNDRISLSWHLTKQEKKRILKAFKSKQNQLALTQLKRLL